MSTKENLGMTLQQLKYFITVAEIGNITYAAQRLYTSQPTISRQIQMLDRNWVTVCLTAIVSL